MRFFGCFGDDDDDQGDCDDNDDNDDDDDVREEKYEQHKKKNPVDLSINNWKIIKLKKTPPRSFIPQSSFP